MKIAVFVNTQAEAHFYKNIIAMLERDGNQVFVLARDCGGTTDLLNELNVPFFQFSSPPDSESRTTTSLPHDVVNAFRYLKDKNVDVTKHRIHDVLSYASLFVTDTQTMATEAALLGTPTIRVSPSMSDCDPVFIELEREFQLLFNLKTASEVAAKAVQLIKNPCVTEDWQKKRDRLLDRKLDMTALMVSLIEEFPASFAYMNASRALRGI